VLALGGKPGAATPLAIGQLVGRLLQLGAAGGLFLCRTQRLVDGRLGAGGLARFFAWRQSWAGGAA